MAITFTNLGNSANPDITTTASASSYSNTSWTPPTSGLIILIVESKLGTNPNVPTVTGNNLTWVNLGNSEFDFGAGAWRGRITLFAANASGSSTGATTISFGGQAQNRFDASFFLAEGVDLDRKSVV